MDFRSETAHKLNSLSDINDFILGKRNDSHQKLTIIWKEKRYGSRTFSVNSDVVTVLQVIFRESLFNNCIFIFLNGTNFVNKPSRHYVSVIFFPQSFKEAHKSF